MLITRQMLLNALLASLVTAGGTFFATFSATTNVQALASATGGSFFLTLASGLGIGAAAAGRVAAGKPL